MFDLIYSILLKLNHSEQMRFFRQYSVLLVILPVVIISELVRRTLNLMFSFTTRQKQKTKVY